MTTSTETTQYTKKERILDQIKQIVENSSGVIHVKPTKPRKTGSQIYTVIGSGHETLSEKEIIPAEILMDEIIDKVLEPFPSITYRILHKDDEAWKQRKCTWHESVSPWIIEIKIPSKL